MCQFNRSLYHKNIRDLVSTRIENIFKSRKYKKRFNMFDNVVCESKFSISDKYVGKKMDHEIHSRKVKSIEFDAKLKKKIIFYA